MKKLFICCVIFIVGQFASANYVFDCANQSTRHRGLMMFSGSGIIFPQRQNACKGDVGASANCHETTLNKELRPVTIHLPFISSFDFGIMLERYFTENSQLQNWANFHGYDVSGMTLIDGRILHLVVNAESGIEFYQYEVHVIVDTPGPQTNITSEVLFCQLR